MTCFIPTLVLCRKTRGEVESQLEYLFEAGGKSPPVARPCECCVLLCLTGVEMRRKTGYFVFTYIDFRSVPRFW